ncbi:hypothetical protein HDF19_16495 [Mucilaginibacter sp. E4BP6]|jgi:hypothetical protein|uniref:hypothetical protein n=1 Tax=Mucilaginibacter sp. E4BP6 TaxID=2723089 RepID=UPI0015CE65B7|nr:hypothetical protein [Mucilaginibacter sp. E4BP6]NYE66513.1 hypothetical protein [Mucilaginibacter sp. E4BP6]
MKTLIITLLCFVSAYTVNAQITFKCADVKYTIPEFKEDAVEKYIWETQFEDLGILQPIQLSKYDIELRCYYDVVSIGRGSAIIIKGDERKIWAEAYFYRIQKDQSDSIPPEGFKSIKYWKRNLYYSVKNISVPDTLLRSLIKHKLFNRQDIIALRDSLKNQGIKIEPSRELDSYSVTYTLKVKNHIRRFNSDPSLFYANSNIKEFSYDVLLFNDFNNLYNSSGQERNHLFP